MTKVIGWICLLREQDGVSDMVFMFCLIFLIDAFQRAVLIPQTA